jgi:hypothetical protein
MDDLSGSRRKIQDDHKNQECSRLNAFGFANTAVVVAV